MITPLRWDGDRLVLVDQTRLPVEEVERVCATWQEVADAIRTLVVRGAPAIGVAAAFGVVLAARASRARDFDAGQVVELRALTEGKLGRFFDGALDDRNGIADRGHDGLAPGGELGGRKRFGKYTLRDLRARNGH